MASSGGSGLKREAFASFEDALLGHLRPAAVLVNGDLRVHEIRGDLKMVSLGPVVGRSLKGALAEHVRALLRQGGGSRQSADLAITAIPVALPDSEPLYCVVFESLTMPQELEITRESLSALVDESEATTEELRSAVEELRAANRDLCEVNEELNSSNQEVARLNARLEAHAKELERANSGFATMIEALRVPIVVLGADLRVKRYTGPAERVLGLRAAHIGKKVGEVDALTAIQSDCANVMITREPLYREFPARSGRSLQAMIRPFVSDEDQSNGVLLAILPGPFGTI